MTPMPHLSGTRLLRGSAVPGPAIGYNSASDGPSAARAASQAVGAGPGPSRVPGPLPTPSVMPAPATSDVR